MRVECVIVSVGYGDMLAATLPENLPLLDSVVVMTSATDVETQTVCRRHNVRYIQSLDHDRDGPFNKARLIQRGLDQIGGRDWILHLDADVVLPRKFRQLTEVAHLDERCIYGADRCNLVGWDKWQNLRRYAGSWDNSAAECGHWFHPECTVGSRWVSSIHGYCPCGYFQLFHSKAMVDGGHHSRVYPQFHGDAARTDIQFSLQWDRRFRQIIPEIIVLHLESEAAPLGTNWQGRKTVRFGPPFVPLAPSPATS